MGDEKRKDAQRNGEFDFINRLRLRTEQAKQPVSVAVSTDAAASRFILPPSAFLSSLQFGIGDDAAIINQHSASELVVTQDLLIEDTDFRRAWMPLKHLGRALGHKALAVSLSDVAAMGARARYCLISIGVPKNIWRTSFVDEFYASLLALAARENVQLIGGDTSASPKRIVIDCTVIGETGTGKSVKRTGANLGDLIFVTGSLGGASAGLKLLEAGKRLSTGRTANESLLNMDALITGQLYPQPRTAWGSFLGTQQLATSMIDLSDGLSSDLHHLCTASKVGATIYAAQLPLNKHIARVNLNQEPLALALSGGEDYELLFTAAPADKHKLPAQIEDVPLTEIGVITEASEGIKTKIANRTRALKAKGFKHF